MSKLIKITDQLPEKGQIVWCLREWYSCHSESLKSEWRLAVRTTDKPLVVDEHPANYCYWADAKTPNIGVFSDVTVVGWVELHEPELLDE